MSLSLIVKIASMLVVIALVYVVALKPIFANLQAKHEKIHGKSHVPYTRSDSFYHVVWTVIELVLGAVLTPIVMYFTVGVDWKTVGLVVLAIAGIELIVAPILIHFVLMRDPEAERRKVDGRIKRVSKKYAGRWWLAPVVAVMDDYGWRWYSAPFRPLSFSKVDWDWYTQNYELLCESLWGAHLIPLVAEFFRWRSKQLRGQKPEA